MKKLILFTMLVGVLALFNTGCKKKTDPVPTNNNTPNYTATKTINGNTIGFIESNCSAKNNLNYTYNPINGTTTPYYILGIALLDNSADTSGILFYIGHFVGVGNYDLTTDVQSSGEYTISYPNLYYTVSNGGSGSVNITSYDGATVSGTYSMIVWNSNKSKSYNITGTFTNVKLH